jgi:hypothetical protein
MATSVELIARAVLRNSPFVRCFRCLSSQVGVGDKDAREAAQLLVMRDGFSIAKRVCQVCGHAEEMLVTDKAP